LTGNSTVTETVHLHNNSSGWALKWSMNSKDCSRRLSALHLRILEDDIDQSVALTSVIPRKCLTYHQNGSSGDSYTALLSSDNEQDLENCHFPNTLDSCRRYTFEMQSEFSSKWKGKNNMKMFFTKGLSNN
jgi:hypothetical protein